MYTHTIICQRTDTIALIGSYVYCAIYCLEYILSRTAKKSTVLMSKTPDLFPVFVIFTKFGFLLTYSVYYTYSKQLQCAPQTYVRMMYLALFTDIEYRVRDSSLLSYVSCVSTTIANTRRINGHLRDRTLSNVTECLYEVVEALQYYSSTLNNVPQAMDLPP